MKNHLSFNVYGAGKPLVQIRGFASTMTSWGFQYRALKKYFKVITIENSTGRSGQSDDGCEISQAVSKIIELIELLAIGKTLMLGSSMGAMIALEFAQRYPEKVTSLILASLPIEPIPALRKLIEEQE